MRLTPILNGENGMYRRTILYYIDINLYWLVIVYRTLWYIRSLRNTKEKVVFESKIGIFDDI